MGLMDALAGKVAQAASGTGLGAAAFLPAILSWIQSPQVGGIPGLMKLFESNGLGNVLKSWLGNQANLPVSGDQLMKVFGKDKLAGLADKIGMTPDAASNQLAGLLPQVIDKLSPAGSMPEGDALSKALGGLGGLFK
jgi:uncharacterized protein YidB (DUF937 family)